MKERLVIFFHSNSCAIQTRPKKIGYSSDTFGCMACIGTNKLPFAVHTPRTVNDHLYFQLSNWTNLKQTYNDHLFSLLPEAIMKFPMNVMGKKHHSDSTAKDNSEKTNNNLNTIYTAQETERARRGSITSLQTPALRTTASTPQMVCRHPQGFEVNNNLPNAGDCEVRRCLDDNGNSCSPQTPVSSEDVVGQDTGKSLELKDVCSSVVDGEGHRSRSNSQFDDSGFNSSASDDKDDECDTNNEGSGTNLPPFPRKTRSHSDVSSLESKESSHQPFHSTHCMSRSKNQKPQGDPELVRTVKPKHSRPRPESSMSELSVDKQASSSSSSPSSHYSAVSAYHYQRIHRRRRARADQNNNEVVGKPLHSYFKRSPVHMQDFFQKNGLLTLVACILYTLMMSVLAAGVCSFITFAKAAFGKEELDAMKAHLLARRRQRFSVTSSTATSG